MKTIYKIRQTLILLCLCICILSSCKKSFLEAKPSTGLLLLNTLSDYQLLLNNTTVFNQTGSLPLASNDEFIIPDYTVYQSLVQQISKNAYVWTTDLYAGMPNITDWNVPYSAIFYANSVLEALPSNAQAGSSEWNRIKGWALFSRAFAYYDLVQNFCSTYDASTADKDLGMPLRLKPGIDEIVQRSSLQQTYNQILTDLSAARVLLTNELSVNLRNEPSKTAALALFSRIYLSMRDYNKAEAYADSCLAIYNKLIDYNEISTTVNSPFTSLNDEVIYQSTQISDYSEVISSTAAKYAISPELLRLYEPNDLRRAIFFRTHANGNVFMKAGYSARLNMFTGLAVDELYLIKAECAARRSDIAVSLSFINSLLTKRYKTGTFIARTAVSAAEALDIILMERRKELIRRGLRWSDLKRLNKEGANITLVRVLNGVTYQLAPNDPKYVFPIPSDEITFSGIKQNPQ